MKYQLTDEDLDAIKTADKDRLLPLYIRLIGNRTMHTDEAQHYAGHIAQAKESYTNDDVEIDDDPAVSPGDDPGIWVAAWVWVAHSEVEGYEDEVEDDQGDDGPFVPRLDFVNNRGE